jgi:hypothetical protein
MGKLFLKYISFLFWGSASLCAYFMKVIRRLSLATALQGAYFIFYIFLPLHVSALAGHLQV